MPTEITPSIATGAATALPVQPTNSAARGDAAVTAGNAVRSAIQNDALRATKGAIANEKRSPQVPKRVEGGFAKRESKAIPTRQENRSEAEDSERKAGDDSLDVVA